MGFETVLLGGISAATTAIGASASNQAAQQQNAAIDRSQQSLVRSTAAAQQQVTDAAALERRKVALNAAQIEGRIRAARATGGQGMGGTTLALIRQNDITEGENLNVIDTNLSNQIDRIQSGFEAQSSQLSAGVVNSGLATLTGGLSGLGTGLNLTLGLANVSRLLDTPVATQPDAFQPVNIL